MRERFSRFGPASWLAIAFIAWVVTLASTRASVVSNRAPAVGIVTAARNSPQAAKPQAPAPTPKAGQPAPGGDTYIGETACADCHDKQKTGYFDSPHHRSTDPRTPAAKESCETCHGPGGKHQDDPVLNPIRDFNKLKPAEVTAICTTCHNKGEHTLWDGSQHESRGLTCTTCHSVHAFKSEQGQLKQKTQLEVCATCHRDKVSKVDRSGHMPVREGKMQCTTCHNVHGSTNVRLLRTGDSIGELCTSCHAEKRGPFLWEHAAGRENCVSCHDPHGSNNDRMLVAKAPMLCQRCHVSSRHPATIYDGAQVANASNRVVGRACVNCHAQIHGSNHPAGAQFLR